MMPRRYFSKAIESHQRPQRSTPTRQRLPVKLPVEFQHMSEERVRRAYSWQNKDTAALPPQDSIDVINRDIAWAHHMFAVLTKRRSVQVETE